MTVLDLSPETGNPNDLPYAYSIILNIYLLADEKIEYFTSEDKPCSTLLVKKDKLAENDEYNLTGDKYGALSIAKHKYPDSLADAVDTITPPKDNGDY